jgi:hypothetical protein
MGDRRVEGEVQVADPAVGQAGQRQSVRAEAPHDDRGRGLPGAGLDQLPQLLLVMLVQVRDDVAPAG